MRPVLLAASALVLAACARAEARPLPAAQQGRAPAPSAPDARVTRADLARIAGAPDAKLWILVVSDFQCPYCKDFHDKTFPAVQKEFVASGVARMAYINYPLNIHPNAVPAAEAAMCAGAQDRFWPFHDRLFGTQATWAAQPNPRPFYDGLAAELKLDVGAWKACMDAHVMRGMIDADYQRGSQAGVRSTPTFIIGRTVIPGNAPIESIRQAVKENLGGAR